MELQLSLAVAIRPLLGGDLDDLEWDSEQAINAEYFRQTIAERGDEVVFLLALLNRRPVGRLGIDFGRTADEGVVHLWAFGVLPALQRLGIGTALMREAETLIASAPRAVTFAEVGVDECNDEAAKLYRRLGYREAGTERGGKGELIRLFRRPVARPRPGRPTSSSSDPGCRCHPSP
jgi:ribosomal protein S18 acetylase RimI-like enzyme